MSLSNVGSADRVIRILIGALLIAAPYFTTLPIWDNSTLRMAVPIIGAVLVLTGLFKFCALYKILGLRTNS